MESENSSPNLRNFVSKHPNMLKNVEIISVSIFTIGFVLHLFEIKNTDYILLLGSILTSLIYFLNAFKIPEIENLETTGILNSATFITFIYKLTYLSYFTLFIGTAALILKKSESLSMLAVSGILLIFILIISLITKISDRSKIYNVPYYLRLIPALILLTFLINIHYRIF
jgi:hypothetical protein